MGGALLLTGCPIGSSSPDTLSGVAFTPALNDTGITKCYDDTVEITCGDSHDGQDAELGRDATVNNDSDGHAGFSFTKIGADGSVLAIQDGSWGNDGGGFDNGSEAAGTKWSCVEDDVTGLIWEVKSHNATPDLYDKGWIYSWYNSDGTTNGGTAGMEDGGNCLVADRCDTEKYVADVNDAVLCGYTDWRLPNPEVLRSIVDYSIASIGPTIDTGWFPNAKNGWVWSSSPSASDPSSEALFVSFIDGGGRDASKSHNYYVRLVRGGL